MRLERILIFGNPAYLSLNKGRLSVEREGQALNLIALIDIAVIMLEHPQIVFTNALLQGLFENDIPVLVSNSRHYPVALWFPQNEHVATVARHRAQAYLSKSQVDGLWQRMITHKIANQAGLLRRCQHLTVLSRMDKLCQQALTEGKTHQSEAHAAQLYWKTLLGVDFKRDKPNANDASNIALNFGYAVLRSMVARYVTISGLNPVFGVGHDNQANPLALVDDLMEMFRPWIDLKVVEYIAPDVIWDADFKRQMLTLVDETVSIDGKQYGFTAAVNEVVMSYARAIEKQTPKELKCPTWSKQSLLKVITPRLI